MARETVRGANVVGAKSIFIQVVYRGAAGLPMNTTGINLPPASPSCLVREAPRHFVYMMP